MVVDIGQIIGNVTASTITDIYYISKKHVGHEQSTGFIKGLVGMVEIIGVDKTTILKALASKLPDFEDAVQNYAAEMNGIELILTKNKNDFENASINILTPSEFLALKR